MKTEEEIKNKIMELYDLMMEYKLDAVKVMLATDVLSWVIGDGDYLDTNEDGTIEW